MRLDFVLNINPGCKIILGSFDSRQLIAKILGEILLPSSANNPS